MIEHGHPSGRISPAAVAWTFVLTVAGLVALQRLGIGDDVTFAVRGGMLQDLLAQNSTGRQALFSSLFFLPLPTFLALPFAPWLPAAAYGWTSLYAVALAVAFATRSLALGLSRCHPFRIAPRPPILLAVALLVATALACSLAQSLDLAVALPWLILAARYELRRDPAARAVAGIFWVLAAWSHRWGLFLVAARVLAGAYEYSRAWIRSDPAGRAVAWLQALTLLYGGVVYLFLAWITLGDGFYAFRKPVREWGSRPALAVPAALEAEFMRRYPGAVPVASGHWGYLVRPFLRACGGHHCIDFHPDKLPAWETRPALLVEPAGDNPVRPLNDTDIRARHNPHSVRACIFSSASPSWRYLLVLRQQKTPRQP